MSWLDSKSSRPIERAVHHAFPGCRPSSSSNPASASSHSSKPLRGATIGVMNQVTSLEQVMRDRMLLYEGSPAHIEQACVEGEAEFAPASPLAGTGLRRGAELASTGKLFLRPTTTQGCGADASGMANASINGHTGKPGCQMRPWSTSEVVPCRELPDTCATAWHPLLSGKRPWPRERDEDMQRVLLPGKSFKRLVDTSSIGGMLCQNDGKNIWYTTLNRDKPQLRSF